MTQPQNGKMLVSGGSGFLGSYVILQLLRLGYHVHTTIRTPEKETEVRSMLHRGGAQDLKRVSFFIADLRSDDGWNEAAMQCDFVIHTASPFPSTIARDENEVIAPARDGTLRVLRAARNAGAKRVVLTSSFGAIAYGLAPRSTAFTEQDWTNTSGPAVTPYIKSKVIAERAAWDFIAQEGGGLELSVINPVGIFGPVLGSDYSSSIGLIVALLNGAMPAIPDIHFGVIDVRDVADLHIRAMTEPGANAERFIMTAGPVISLFDAANILRNHLGAAAAKVPARKMPSWLVRALGVFLPAMRNMAPQLGIVRNASNEKAKRVFSWTPRPTEEVIAATGSSLAELNSLKHP